VTRQVLLPSTLTSLSVSEVTDRPTSCFLGLYACPATDGDCGAIFLTVNFPLITPGTPYCTDQWVTYASVIPQDKLVQSKATTNAIERNHCRQRHWFGRFKRKSIIVSKSQEMVNLTMALFAKFWVNGNQDELLSLLG
jgi:hypothetical protein